MALSKAPSTNADAIAFNGGAYSALEAILADNFADELEDFLKRQESEGSGQEEDDA